jgi:hypothetical protein
MYLNEETSSRNVESSLYYDELIERKLEKNF